MSPRLYSGCTCISQCAIYFVGGDNLQTHQWWTDCPEGPIPAVDGPHVESQYGSGHGGCGLGGASSWL